MYLQKVISKKTSPDLDPYGTKVSWIRNTDRKDAVPAYVDWRAGTAIPLSGLG
jgi:hypothetical protein